MFYNLVYKLPIWIDIDSKSRNIRLIVLGTILYILIHSFIYSNYVNNYEFILDNRKYLYYLIAFDLTIITTLIYFGFGTVKQKNKKLKKSSLYKNKKNFNKSNFFINKNKLPFRMNGMPQYGIYQNFMPQNGFYPNEIFNQMQSSNKNQNQHNKNINKINDSKNIKKEELNENDSIKLPIYQPKTQNLNENNNMIPIYGSKINNDPISENIPLYKSINPKEQSSFGQLSKALSN